MQTQISLLLTNDINKLIENIAIRMGTSKRNVISLALSDIIQKDISREYIDSITERVKGLTHATNITVTEAYKEKIYSLERYGLSIRKFVGYLVCDYFYQNKNDFINEEHESTKFVQERDNIQFKLDPVLKEKITTYCKEHSMTLNSLFAHYILNKKLNNFKELLKMNTGEKNGELTNLTFSKKVKRTLINQAEMLNVDYRYYLQLKSYQIITELKL